MPVDTQHAEYDAHAEDWTILRHVLAGARAVKHEGEAYLPRLSEQSDADYNAYRDRAQFLNVTSRTLDSLTGFVFRKDPQQVFPDALVPFMDDATMTGLSFYAYAIDTVREILSVGRRGTLVDFSQAPDARPYVAAYRTEDIINWKCERRNGRMVLTMVVLHELDPEWIPLTDKERREGPPDQFEQGQYDQWRVLELRQDPDGNPFVFCTVYRRKEKEKAKDEPEFVPVKQSMPTRRGQPLHRIPFVFHGAHNALPSVDKAPLLDLADVNLSHYRTSADLENGRHVTGLPTPYACGFDVKEEFRIGSNVAWITDEANAKVGFLEFTGQGLGALEKAMADKERQMAALGARMLQPEASKAEAFDTVAMRSAAETSALQNATNACTESLSDVLQWVAWWIGTAPDPEDLEDTASVELNSEFTITRLPADAITALTNAYLASAIDFETYVHNLTQGDIVPPGRTLEEIRESINSNPPALPQQKTPPEPTPGA